MEQPQIPPPEKSLERQALLQIIRSAWDERTTDDWHPEDPARHHCGVTALVVQDFLGGTIVRNVINGRTVYFSRLPDGGDLFHSDEYEGQARHWPTDQEQTRDQMMTHHDMPSRYALLSTRVRVSIVTQGDPLNPNDREQATLLWGQLSFATPEISVPDRGGLLEAIHVWAQPPFQHEDYWGG